MTTSQQAAQRALVKGCHIKLRVSRRGRLGDFLILNRSEIVQVVTRRTMAAICGVRLPREGRKAKQPKVPAPASVFTAVDEEFQVLDDVARGMAKKPFARLNAADQAAVRNIARRLQEDCAEGRRG